MIFTVLKCLVILISVINASVIPKSSIERVKWFADNNFQSFSDMLTLLGDDLSEEEATGILSIDNFEPLFNFFAGKSVNSSEIEQLLYLANKHLATGDRMNEILDTYFKYAIESKVPLPDLAAYGHVHLALYNYLTNRQFGIKTNENEVELDGWEVNEESKQWSLQLFKALAFLSTSVSIKNLPIDDFTFDQIQLVLHSNLKSISFENCQILNPNKYFQLNQLTSFKFSDSYCKNFIEMLRTISRDSLIQLDISNNAFNEQEISNLTILFKEFKQLESLNISFSFPHMWRRSKFTGEIIKLTNLKSLNVSGNLDFESFATELNKSAELINLEELNLSNNGRLLSEATFINNLSKFKALKSLDLSHSYLNDCDTLSTTILEMETLEKVTFNRYMLTDGSYNLIVRNQQRRIPIKLFFSTRLNYEIPHPHNLLQMLNTNDPALKIATAEFHSQNFDTTSLYIDFSGLPQENPTALKLFFSRFTKLQNLSVHLMNPIDLVILKILLDNNSIKTFEFAIYFEFDTDNLKELAVIIGNYKFSSFIIKRLLFSDEAVEKYKQFLDDLSKAKLWEELEFFSWYQTSFGMVDILLSKAKFKKLHEVSLRKIYGDEKEFSFVFPTVRKLNFELDYYSSSSFCNLPNLAKAFPNVIELRVAFVFNLKIPPYFSFPKNIRFLDIHCDIVEDYKNLIQALKKLRFLTKLIFIERESGPGHNSVIQFTNGKHLNFPHLTFVWLKTTSEKLKKQFVVEKDN